MGDSRIEWTDRTWNPVRGCSRVSAGCENCYAQRQARRFDRPGGTYEGLTRKTARGPVWSGKIRCVPALLDVPMRWRKPAKIFVNSMSDLFHEDVPEDFLDQVFAVMALCPEHTFQVLTKRADRMAAYVNEVIDDPKRFTRWAARGAPWARASDRFHRPYQSVPPRWPLPNVWLGVSVENQDALSERIGKLASFPNAKPWISAEPLLGPIDFGPMLSEWGIEWVVVGGESGPGARRCEVHWIRDIVAHCKSWVVPVFVKQLGANTMWMDHCGGTYTTSGKGGDPDEWPPELRVREMPLERG